MEVIYLIALEISIILGALKLFSLELGIFFSLILVLGIFTQSVKSEELLNDARNVKPPKVIQKLAENPKDRAIA